MTAQTRYSIGHRALPNRAPRRSRDTAKTAVIATALLGCVVPNVGCKTGTAFTKPSWWTFGGAPKADADSLAAAPPYSGDIKKPSESAKQYPTTSTPSGYVITGTASPASAVAQQFQNPQPQSPVVYGSTPPPSVAAAATAETPPAALPQQTAPSSIAPQVGPYAALAGDSIPPPGQPLPPIAPSNTPPTMPTPMPSMASTPATPAETALPNTAYSSFSGPAAGQFNAPSPAPRMADARAADPAAAIPAAALPVEQPAYGGSRYSASTGSRFGGAEAASFSPAATAPPTSSYATPPESGFAAPAGVAPMNATPPLGSPPQLGTPPAMAPASPGLLQPSGQPVRRPDPGYRPGGTSSYRPSRTILADESGSPTTVRTASYEEPAGTVQQ